MTRGVRLRLCLFLSFPQSVFLVSYPADGVLIRRDSVVSKREAMLFP